MSENVKQPRLISGFYRCSNCGLDVDSVQRTRRFWLCDQCWAAIMPDWEKESRNGNPAAWHVDTEEQMANVEAYWQWYDAMCERYPAKRVTGRTAGTYLSWRQEVVLNGDMYWPVCKCGGQRREMTSGAFPPGLFGGPFASLCARCEAEEEVKRLVEWAPKLAPGRDDEEWLDLLYKSHRHLFELGILPGMWWEMRRWAHVE